METIASLLMLAVLVWWGRQWLIPNRSPAWAAAVARLAKRYGGYTETSPNGYPATYFEYQGGVRAWTSVERRRWLGGWATEITVSGPEVAGLVRIRPATAAPGEPLPNTARLDTSSDEVLWRYVIEVDDAARSRNLFTDDVKWRVDQLRQFLPSSPWELQLENGTLVLRKQHPLEQAYQLERCVELALSCYEALWESFSCARTAKSVWPKLPGAGLTCPVCLQEVPAVDPEHHVCPRCGTWHHEDCWKYNGGCAGYGCG
ncbi:MAG: hypothetical protein KatS3mg110_3143 [Pirellulaceae bacterium]|nr:MAG: hypothetical protein KatS3mg110_3143 [Pirellulaceae bacterium]